MNQVALIGRLAGDPELKHTPKGVAVTQFRLAVDRRSKDKATDFFTVIAWRTLAETVANHLQKGRLIAVSGRLQHREWERDGQQRSAVEVVAESVDFLDYPKREGRKPDAPDEDLPF